MKLLRSKENNHYVHEHYADQCCKLYDCSCSYKFFVLLCSTIKHEDIIHEETKQYKNLKCKQKKKEITINEHN